MIRRVTGYAVIAGVFVAFLSVLLATALAAKRRASSEPKRQVQSVTRPPSYRVPLETLGRSVARPVATTSMRTSAEPPMAPAAGVSDYSLPWYSFNAAGIVGGSSSTHGFGASMGETFAGDGASVDFTLAIGFWNGTAGCACRHQGDFDDDGFITVMDMGAMIDILFADKPNVWDPNCPTSRMEYLCDEFPDILDLGACIDHLFANAPPPCQPCTDL